MTEYKFYKQMIINGKKRKIYTKSGSKKIYLKYKGKMMNVVKFTKLKTKKKGGSGRFFNRYGLIGPQRIVNTTRLAPPLPLKKETRQRKIPPMPRSPSPVFSRTSNSTSRKSSKRSSRYSSRKPEVIRLGTRFIPGTIESSSKCKKNGDPVPCIYENKIRDGMCLNGRCVIPKYLLDSRLIKATTRYPSNYPRYLRMPGHR